MTDEVWRLLDERIAEAQTQRAALQAAVDATREARRLTFTDDEHDPEGSTASLDQARDTALLRQVVQTLTELVAARDRLAAGTYGVCERCGRPIAPARLEARPEARTCVSCAGRSRR